MCKCLHAPKICGKWVVCKSCSLEETDLSKVNCSNSCSCNGTNNNLDSFQVTQNNMFVKFVRESDNQTLMGIWRPLYKDGSIKEWELKLVYGESQGEFLMQISKLDSKSCKPSEMFFTYMEKAVEATDDSPEVPPILMYGAIKKLSCTCC